MTHKLLHADGRIFFGSQMEMIELQRKFDAINEATTIHLATAADFE